MKKPIDLRSDTVTLPTPSMRQAMAAAEVGDDVHEEDPTINRLQLLAAELTGMEDALFVPSGTMGNLIAILTTCGRGDEAIMGTLSHTFLNEAGGSAALGGVHPCPIPNQPDGTLNLDDIRHAIRSEDVHHPVTRLIILENTQNVCGGVALSPAYTHQVAELAHENGLHLHLDGARIFNAAVAQQVNVKELTRPADSMMFCLSKGLSAPVGSMLCGNKKFIRQARHIRKQVGGGMRQAGVIAAAGIIALEEMVERLSEDHARARQLAKGLSSNTSLVLDTVHPQTNMVYLSLAEHISQSASRIYDALMQHNILVDVVAPRRFRLVTHYGIEDDDIETVIQCFTAIFR